MMFIHMYKQFSNFSIVIAPLAYKVSIHALKCDVYGNFSIAASPDENVEKYCEVFRVTSKLNKYKTYYYKSP